MSARTAVGRTPGNPMVPVRRPEIIEDFYDPGEVDLLFDVVRSNAPWSLILAGTFKTTEEYLAFSGARERTARPDAPLSDFIAPTFRAPLAESGVLYYPELTEIYYGRTLMDPVKGMHGAAYGMPSRLAFNVVPPSHSFDAGHFDTPEFRGVNITNTPVWLLGVMHKSGLFAEWTVKNGQMITYFYDGDEGGGFTYWPDGPDAPPERLVPPFHNTCMLSDNSTMYHRRESGGPVDQRDYPDLRIESLLHHDGAGSWSIRTDGREIARYRDEEMRYLVHYTALVFDDLADVRRYLDHTEDLSHDQVLDTLVGDLRRRGITVEVPADPLTDRDFITLLSGAYAMAPKTYPTEAPLAVMGAA